ncbi:hypothetical protein HLH17_14515 [Acinetobacter sp. ANC 5380]|uniref:Uncharacterized protein n=1 Tax=Acinetobacter terrae TaxID=2731247 RepID=A0A7Y2RHG8_9GAMM|nr:hypothetical protein [Acinetobacter terrae]NNH78835.1 hypothetical protein [Acinetobacter terrae]
MKHISTFLESLDINQAFLFPSHNKVEIFGLWKIEIISPREMIFYSKNGLGQWERKNICDCYVQLAVHKGLIEINTGFAQCLEEALDHQDEIVGWCAAFEKVIFNRICDLYDENGLSYRQESDNSEIALFISNCLKKDNFETLFCLIGKLHSFFKTHIFGCGSFDKFFSFAPNRIRISSLVNLVMYPVVVNKFNKYLSNQYVVVRLIQISEELLQEIECNGFANREDFARLILANIDDEARFSDQEINFFLNCKECALEGLSNTNEYFIRWLRFFAEVAADYHYENVDLLFKKFILIGYENCLMNKAYIKEIFHFFKERNEDGNGYDLKYALKYSLIFNSIDWNQKFTGNIDELIMNLDFDIDNVRKKSVLLGFVKLKKLNAKFIKNGFSFKELPSDFVENLIVNCNLLLGMGISSASESDLAFMVQKIDDHYVLVGSEPEISGDGEERPLYHIVLSDDMDASLSSGASLKMRKYFDNVMLSN